MEKRKLTKSFESEGLDALKAKEELAREKERERKKIVYENMFRNFSSNYTKTLEDMLSNSKHYYHKKA